MVSVDSGIMQNADLSQMNACLCMRKPPTVGFRIDAGKNSDASFSMLKLQTLSAPDLF
jgi:hypothetical protein